MARGEYAREFAQHFQRKDYRGAYSIFTDHPRDVLGGLREWEMLGAYLDFLNTGMASEAAEFYKAVQEDGHEQALRLIQTAQTFADMANGDLPVSVR